VAREVAVFRPEDVDMAVRRYARVHWGERGLARVRKLGAPNPYYEPATELGTLVQVVYRTTKRGDGESDYFHDFESPRPVLGFSRAGLFILGGGYTVTTHGIEG
jgi:hypothetical protein